MTTYEHVRHADLERQRQMRAVEVARRVLVDGITKRRHKMTEAEREHLSADDAKAEFDRVVVDIDVIETWGLVVVPA